MKILSAHIGLLAAISAAPAALPAQEQDSLAVYRYREVVVSSTRLPVEESRSPLAVSRLSRTDLELLGPATVADAVNPLPGIVVRPYGGTGGAIRTFSLRGMSSENALVLVDNIPIDNEQTGITDLALLPLDMLTGIETVRGGSSSSYGANAAGGMVNLITRETAGASALRVETSARSFGIASASLALVHAPAGPFTLSGGGSAEGGRADYPVDPGGDALRENVDYHTRHAWFTSHTGSDSTLTVRSFAAYLESDRGTPGPLIPSEQQGLARQYDENLLASATAAGRAGPDISLSLGTQFRHSFERYQGLSGLFKASNYYQNSAWSLVPQVSMAVSGTTSALLGAELNLVRATGNALPDTRVRRHAGIFASVSQEFAAGGRWSLLILPSLRYDGYSDVAGRALSPSVGANIRLQGSAVDWILRGSVARNFRVPTLNELYYAGGGGYGNPGLTPEHSTSIDAGLAVTTRGPVSHELAMTFYHIETEDAILWLPASSVYLWSPRNVGRTLSRGIELEGRSRIASPDVSVAVRYCYLDARKRYASSPGDPTYDRFLPFVPLETGGITIQWAFHPGGRSVTTVMLRLADDYTGSRYLTENNDAGLPAYHLLSAMVALEGTSGSIPWMIRYAAANLAGHAYEVMPGYPMPLRSHELSMSLEPHF